MNAEIEPNNLDATEKIRNISTVELLSKAAIMFDDCQALYKVTKNSQYLQAKKWLFETIVVEAEEYCEDWDKHKERISNKLKFLVIEMNNVPDSLFIERIGHGHNGNRSNVFYELIDDCLLRDGLDREQINVFIANLTETEK